MEAVKRRRAIQVFVDGADQHLAPEAADRALGLAFLAKPIEHGDALEIRALLILAPDRQQPAGDRKLVGQGQERELAKTSREMKRRTQPAGSQYRRPSARLDEVELFVEMDPVGDVQALIEIHDIDAAAQQQVLALIDDFGAVARQRVGSGAATQESAGFEQVYLESLSTQRGGCCQAGETAANDDRSGHIFPGQLPISAHRISATSTSRQPIGTGWRSPP